MKNPVAVAAASALVALTLVGPAVAHVPQVVDGPDLVAIGTVISVGNTSLAIRTLDHGHTISFVVSTTTLMPTSVPVGSRVRVDYHAVGTTDQVADKVTLLETPPTTADPTPAPRTSEPQSPSTANQPGTRATELPATASPLPLIGFVGLMALLASASLRALARARF